MLLGVWMRISDTNLSGTALTRFTFSWTVVVHLDDYRPLGRDVSSENFNAPRMTNHDVEEDVTCVSRWPPTQ